jgi:hypothetical protein
VKTFFAFLCGILVAAGAAALYKEMPTIIKYWSDKPDVSVHDSTTDDSTTDDSTTTTDDNTTTTDDSATVQSNDESTYDDGVTSNDDSSDSFFPDVTIPSSNDATLPSYPIPNNNDLQVLDSLRSICHQLQDLDRAVNQYPVLHPCP